MIVGILAEVSETWTVFRIRAGLVGGSITKLEQYDIAGATAIATVMLVIAFTMLLGINLLQAWARRT